MIRGISKNVAISPIGYKDLKPEETFVPAHIELRNGRLTDAGNWIKRYGYAEKWDIGIDNPIDLLIPELTGYAVSESGRVFLLPGITEYTGATLSGLYRPQWCNHQGTIIICDGGSPVKIASGNTALLGGSPPSAKYVDTLDSYVLMAGHLDTTFRWSAAGNNESWPAANYNDVLSEGEVIKYMVVFKRDVFFLKSKSIEVWTNIGGATVFARKFMIEKGCGASYSVVKSNDTLYWFGDDGDFYVLDGISPKVISKSYRSELDKLVSRSTIYGYDYREEGIIRWFAAIDGKCFVFDYTKNVFSEDNTWATGEFGRLPFNSHMVLDGETYVGDYNNTGLIYHWDKDYVSDNGGEIRVLRQFLVPLSSDGTLSRVNRMRIRVKRGVATASEASPVAQIRWRFDQNDWGNYEEIDLGAAGDRNPYIDITGIGIGSEISLEVVESDNVEFLVTGINLTAEALGK